MLHIVLFHYARLTVLNIAERFCTHVRYTESRIDPFTRPDLKKENWFTIAWCGCHGDSGSP